MVWIRWIILLPYFFLAWKLLGITWEGLSNYHRIALSLALGAAFLVGLTLFTSSWTHSLPSSLKIGALCSLAGIIGIHYKYKEQSIGSWKISWSWELIPLSLWVMVTTILVALIAIKFDFQDQMRSQGHPAVVESILRGNFPPQLQLFPNIPLKYHFGGDLLASIFGYVIRLSGINSLNLLQIFGWVAAILCLYTLAREIGMSRSLALLALQWVMLGAGWVYLLRPWLDIPINDIGYNWPDNYTVFKRYINPGMTSNFFQTPYSLGLSIFFTYLTLFFRWLQTKKSKLIVLTAVVLGILSCVHVSLFLTSLISSFICIFILIFYYFRQWKIIGLELLMLGGIGFFLALKFGGFFVASDTYSKGLTIFQWPLGFLRYALPGGGPINWKQSLLWYLCTFGSILLVALPVAIFGFRRFFKWKDLQALFFLTFGATCYFIPQFFHYALTWDIIKWFTGFAIAVSLLTLYLLSFPFRRRAWVLALIICFIFLDTVPGMRFLKGLGITQAKDLQGNEKKWLLAKIPPPTPAMIFFIQHLKSGSWNETLLGPKVFAESLARYTGQSVAYIDYNTPAFGVRQDILTQRVSDIQTAQQNFSITFLSQSPFRWILYSCDEFAKTFSPQSQLAIEDSVSAGELQEIAVPPELGCWKFYHLVTSLKQ
jgi:hypothetical protein